MKHATCFYRYLFRNWVTNSISPGERPTAQNGFGGTGRWRDWVDDISAVTTDAPGVGALAA
jgi:hypothetical protein